jgi:DNA ligase-1
MAKEQPMLAAKFDLAILEDQLKKLSYPLLGSPKFDGIRVLCHPTLGPVTRKFIPLPNVDAREYLAHPLFKGFDGEIIVGLPYMNVDTGDVFARSRQVMARGGKFDFRLYVFDDFTHPTLDYWTRMRALSIRIGQLDDSRIVYVQQKVLNNWQEVLAFEEESLDTGYEGIMLRHGGQPYKFGRSTLRQQHLIKMKRLLETEATIIGYEQKFHNANELVKDNLGYAKRSAHKENQVPLEMLGSWLCRAVGFTETFKVGVGWDHTTASEWWQKGAENYIGKTFNFEYQACGTIDRPRHPIFRHWRED